MRSFAKFCLLIGILNPVYADQIYLVAMRCQTQLKASHFTFFLNKKTQGEITYDPNLNCIRLYLQNTLPHIDIKPLQFSNANVRAIQTEVLSDNRLQFTFHLKTKVTWQIHFLNENKKQIGVRLLLDIHSIDATIKTEKPQLTPVLIHRSHEVHRPSNPLVIVIDAGHGGKDPGAVGKRTKEKDIVLAIAKQLAKEINQNPNQRAILTRHHDRYVPLRERLKCARKGKADLFVAIHADAFFNRESSGASVFALSQHGATTEAARWLAKHDQYDELGDVSLSELKDNSTLLRSFLIDLAQTATIKDSILLGHKVLAALKDVALLHTEVVAQAPFVVLKSPDIPSILVETGFISNPQEEKRLADPGYRNKIAHALYLGIENYLQQ